MRSDANSGRSRSSSRELGADHVARGPAVDRQVGDEIEPVGAVGPVQRQDEPVGPAIGGSRPTSRSCTSRRARRSGGPPGHRRSAVPSESMPDGPSDRRLDSPAIARRTPAPPVGGARATGREPVRPARVPEPLRMGRVRRAAAGPDRRPRRDRRRPVVLDRGLDRGRVRRPGGPLPVPRRDRRGLRQVDRRHAGQPEPERARADAVAGEPRHAAPGRDASSCRRRTGRAARSRPPGQERWSWRAACATRRRSASWSPATAERSP